MSIAGRLSVLAHGMVTAAGFNGPATCAAMRGRITGIREDNLYDPTGAKRLVAGRPRLPQWWEGRDMLAEVVAPAVNECLEAAARIPDLGRGVRPQQVPVMLIVSPRDRPHRFADLDQHVMYDLAHKLGRPELPQGSYSIPAGRTGIVRALLLAHEQISAGRAPFVVLAGVESFLRQCIAEHYIRAGRLLCEVNSNGFVAGEAGCAVLVGPSHRTTAAELVIAGMGGGSEPGGDGGTEAHPVRGDGLTQAVRTALAEAAEQYSALEFTISDLNGERFKFKEATIMAARLDRPRAPGSGPRRYGYVDMWHPVEYLGEIGAAIFPCMLGWAFEASAKGYAPGSVALLFAGEDGGDRVALVTHWKPAGKR